MFKVFAYSTSLVLLSLGLLACGGGGGGSGSSTAAPGTVSFGLSDAPVDGLSAVVITIDSIELRRKDSGDCDNDPATGDCEIINDFTEEGEVVDTITVDLLDLQLQDGNNQIIIQNLELEAGEYDQLRLSVKDEDTNFSWVKEFDSGDERKELKVPSDGLKLGGFTVESGGVQVFVIEFDLRKAMTYNPGSKDRYILKPTGVRVVEATPAASISGTVDPALFTGNGTPLSPCLEKEYETEGNVIYLYQGHGLDPANLADNFDRTEDPAAPAGAIAPYTSQKAKVDAVDGGYGYGVYYLPAGDYTLAFSCEAVNDDPEDWDGIVIPSPDTDPDTTIVELSLGEGEDGTCDLPLVDGACAPVVP